MRLSPRVSCYVLVVFMSLLMGCGGGDEGFTGTTATLSWDPVVDSSGVAYTVHYGKDSTGEPGSCNYQQAVDVSQPYAVITGLEPNTHYYFAVSASNGQGTSLCSNEVSKLTPDMEMRIGDPPVDVHSPGPPCDEIYCAAYRPQDCRDQQGRCGGI